MQGRNDSEGDAPLDWRLVAAASSGLFGVQIVWGLQNVSTSRIFQTLGADMADLPMLWIAGPVTGLLIQPLVGYFSDRTGSRFGRRRPYLVVGAVLTIIGMLGLGYARSLGEAVVALWLLTASVNIAMQPLRAHLADLVPGEQRGVGYALQVAFIGSGAVLASAMPWLLGNWFGIDSTGAAGRLPPTVGLSFVIGAALLAASVIVSLRTPDPPLERGVALIELDGRAPPPVPAWQPLSLAVAAILLSVAAFLLSLRHEIYLLAAIALGFALALGMLRRAALQGRDKVRGPLEIVADIVAMPAIMKSLAWVQFFTWFGLFAFWVYAVPAVAARDRLLGAAGYDDSADRVGLLFATFDATALVVAFALPGVIRRLGGAISHLVCLAIGAAGLFLFASGSSGLSWLAAIAIGVAWASILSAPYAMVANAVPAARVGTYMGIHNIFLVIPQLIAATSLGALVDYSGSGPMAMLWLAGGCLVVAALLSLRLRPGLLQGGAKFA